MQSSSLSFVLQRNRANLSRSDSPDTVTRAGLNKKPQHVILALSYGLGKGGWQMEIAIVQTRLFERDDRLSLDRLVD